MKPYRFLTTWCLEAPVDHVWEAIHDSERWPEWWKGVERVVELEAGDDEGRGALTRYTWRSRLPYNLEFDMRVVHVERPYFLEGQASGELAGEGRWRLFEANGTTAVTYEWVVHTTRPWMNALAPWRGPCSPGTTTW